MSIHKTIFIRLLSSRFLHKLGDWRCVFQGGRIRRSRQLYNTRHHDHLNMPLLCGPEVHTNINDKGIPRESPIPGNVTLCVNLIDRRRSRRYPAGAGLSLVCYTCINSQMTWLLLYDHIHCPLWPACFLSCTEKRLTSA